MSETRIDVAAGKYTVIHDHGAGLRALRYGETWRDLAGDGLVLALAQEVEALRQRPGTQAASHATPAGERPAQAEPMTDGRAAMEAALRAVSEKGWKEGGTGFWIIHPNTLAKVRTALAARERPGAQGEYDGVTTHPEFGPGAQAPPHGRR